MASLNQFTGIGNVGKTPEIKTVGDTKVANFSLAMGEKWKDRNGEQKERTEWLNVAVWGDGLCGVIERYVEKGSQIMLQGQIRTRKYEKDGSDRYVTELVLQGPNSKLVLLGGKSGGERTEPKPSEPTGGYDAGIDDEIPF